MHKKAAKRKTPYIENGISFTFYAFLAHPVLTYRKLNAQSLMNGQFNVDVHVL